jgi:hypothetical protein
MRHRGGRVALEGRDERLRREQRRLEVRIDHRVPGRFGIFLERAVIRNSGVGWRSKAGVVDQNGGRAKPFRDVVDRRKRLRAIQQIRVMNRQREIVRDQRLDDRADGGRDVDHRDARSGARQRRGVLRSQPPQAARNDRDLAIEGKQVRT